MEQLEKFLEWGGVKREISCPMMRKKKIGSTQLTRMERMGLAWVGMVAVNVMSGSSRS